MVEATSPGGEGDGDAPWRDVLAPFTEPSLGRSLLSLATSLVPYLLLLVAIYLASHVSIGLAFALALAAAGFLIRTLSSSTTAPTARSSGRDEPTAPWA